MTARSLYFDWNATTPPHPDVLDAMRAAAARSWGNPSSVHAVGRAARAVVEEAREALGALLEVHPRDVILTSGGTEANNLALRDARAPALVCSRLEHPSVTRVAEERERAGGTVIWLPVPPSGRVEVDAVAAAIASLPPGFVVALMAVNHETGVIQPVAGVAEVVHARGGRLHVDAVQAVGKLPPDVLRGADSLTFAAHKIRGPKGIGALAWSGPPPAPVLLGGAQERGIRPGTGDPVAAAGLLAALRHARAGMVERYAALSPLRDRLEAALSRHGTVNGLGAPRAPHVTNVSLRGARGDEWVAAFDLEGLHVASGSACSAGTSEPSAVIRCMAGEAAAAAAVRFSLGEGTTSSDVDDAIVLIDRVLARQSSRS